MSSHYEEEFRVIDGVRLRIRFFYDEDMREPWKEVDGHGIVSEWERRNKRAGERVLCQDGRDYGAKRFYNVTETMKIARRDGWGSAGDEGLKPGAKAARAVEADFKRLQDWCNDEWWWMGVEVSDPKTGERQSLWGIESDSEEYLDSDVIPELASELLDARKQRWRLALAERREYHNLSKLAEVLARPCSLATVNPHAERLEYLRSQLRAECISYGELADLQGLAEHIDPGDTELLEAAGVPEQNA